LEDLEGERSGSGKGGSEEGAIVGKPIGSIAGLMFRGSGLKGPALSRRRQQHCCITIVAYRSSQLWYMYSYTSTAVCCSHKIPIDTRYHMIPPPHRPEPLLYFCSDHSTPKPMVSSTAMVNFCSSTSYDLYAGRSILLKHV